MSTEEQFIYRVSVEYEMYVLAKDCVEAEYAAERSVRDEEPCLTTAREVTPSMARTVPSEWMDSIPINGDTRSVAEILGVKK